MKLSLPHHYILEGKKAVPCDDIFVWGEQMASEEIRRVCHTVVGDYGISTVFLCVDINLGRGEPALFETMVFGRTGAEDWNERIKYSTWEDAEKGHKAMCDLVKESTEKAKAESQRAIKHAFNLEP